MPNATLLLSGVKVKDNEGNWILNVSFNKLRRVFSMWKSDIHVMRKELLATQLCYVLLANKFWRKKPFLILFKCNPKHLLCHHPIQNPDGWQHQRICCSGRGRHSFIQPCARGCWRIRKGLTNADPVAMTIARKLILWQKKPSQPH